MKRYILIVTGFLFLFSAASAQNEFDVMRYSQSFPYGTARSLGLGGAIGAVGGDFTSLSVNPAGLGLYRQSELTFTPSFNWNKTSSDFMGNSYTDTKYNFNFGNIGFVANNNINENKGWISTNFGIGYNQMNNFSGKVFMEGESSGTSLLDNFVYFANENPNDLDPYYEQLAFDAFLLPYDTIDNLFWNDIQNAGYGQEMSREVKTRGGIGEYLLSFGANYNHKLYLGASLGIKRVHYEENIIHSESDPGDEIDYFDAFDFYEDIYTKGTGYTFKIGAIARPIPVLRIGASYHLPTFYNLRDERITDFIAYIDPSYEEGTKSESSPFNEFSYRLTTPGKFVASAALTVPRVGLISVDWEFIDYTQNSFESDEESFRDENIAIEELYRATQNLRVGGELKLGNAYLRGGYGFYGSPFVESEANSIADKTMFSAGAGVRDKYFFVDMSFTQYNQDIRYYLYTVPEGTNAESLNSSKFRNLMLTVGFRF